MSKNQKFEVKIYELLGIKLFKKAVFKLEKIIHRKDGKKNINYHIKNSNDMESVDNFKKFLDENKDNLDSCEYLIPSVLSKGIKEGYCNVSVIKTNSKWVGVTYKEDKKDVVEYIKNIVEEGEYNSNLWK